ncbi:MAG: erythromycin esterase family protein [Pseudomonadota bacterium]
MAIVRGRLKLSLVGALLIMLTACGGGASGSPDVAAAPPAPAPSPPPSGLLTNSQLRTAADPSAAFVATETSQWFATHAKVIRSLTVDDDFSDLEFFDALIADKRLVLLGESTHGAEEYSQAKIRLIKYLHETQGYNVLAFEGGLFDCERAQELLVSASARSAMNSCLFGVWQTPTVLELLEYVRSTQATANPLRITGFDVQASGTRFNERAERTRALFEKISAERAVQVFEIERAYAQLVRAALGATSDGDAAMVALRSNLTTIQVDYALIADELEASAATITADGQFSTRDVQIAAQYARTSPDWAEQAGQRFTLGRGSVERDRGMASNLLSLSQSIYSNDKIIAWAHNAHLRHRGTGLAPNASMGAIVHRSLEDSMYTVGFYMYRGQHALPDGAIRTIAPPMNNSLESIFYASRLAWLFLDLENAPATQGHEWINLPTPTWTWGDINLPLTLADEYDGLFIVDSVVPPNSF